MSGITTHVLDTSRGEPARGLTITLQRLDERGGASTLGTEATDQGGRSRALLGEGELRAGRYRLVFDTGAYLRSRGSEVFFPQVVIEFEVRDAGAHYHVPLLLSPYGYSTYRGS